MILNGRRRYIRARKSNHDELHRMNIYVEKEAWLKADQMAGADPLGVFVQELIVREYRRREKRMVQESDFAIKCTDLEAL